MSYNISIVLFVLGIVIGGIGTLVTVTFCIIALATNKNRNAGIWAAGFAISLIILIASVLVVVKRLSQKVRQGIEWAQENSSNNYQHGDYVDTKSQDRQYFLDTLQNNTLEKYEGNIPPEFYLNKVADIASDGRLIFPFLYPYNLQYNPNNFLGDIISSKNDSVFVQNITQLAFDKNFVICKVDNTSSKELLKAGRGEIEYIFFDMRTAEYLTFVNEAIMLDKANKIGYEGPTTMTYISDDYKGWIESQDYN